MSASNGKGRRPEPFHRGGSSRRQGPGPAPEPAAEGAGPSAGPSAGPRRRAADTEYDKPRGLERIADLLPRTAREFGLEEQLEQARVGAAWDRLVAGRMPAARGACRLLALERGIATIQCDLPIVAQEVRLRTPELLSALRAATGLPIAGLQPTVRHV
jgi:hypothetical protein